MDTSDSTSISQDQKATSQPNVRRRARDLPNPNACKPVTITASLFLHLQIPRTRCEANNCAYRHRADGWNRFVFRLMQGKSCVLQVTGYNEKIAIRRDNCVENLNKILGIDRFRHPFPPFKKNAPSADLSPGCWTRATGPGLPPRPAVP